MRILQVSSARVFGGGERHFVDLCRGLANRGHDVFAAIRPTNEWRSRLDFLPPENILDVSIRNSFGVLSANRIGAFVRDKRISLVHAHVARDYIPASIACMLARDARFVLTRHLLFPLRPFNRFALKNLSKAIAVSKGVEASLKNTFPLDKIVMIQNGIDVETWAARAGRDAGREFRELHGISPDAPLVGIMGELTPLKGQRDFVFAANEILKTVPDAHFAIIGRDNTIDRKFRRELKRLVKVLRRDDHFLWLDWVDDTIPFMSAIDVFVSASHSESFGIAMLEAMSAAVPVVATKTMGARELLEGEDVLVPVGEPVELAGRVTDLLLDPENARSLGERMQARAAERFSIGRMVEATELLYSQIVAGNGE